ncbi:hypothetical protein [Vibrio superstes]|uniref:RNA polymerase sigma-70 region 4 domain-containing protein n=1 Tax=Vibrio superstes NBRC 103154 TaxID=1219062 RepID=A0A511QSD3_9VIBR|nr:hypothetical protein [Vibrio superstes]GEM80259.1 hypothetical protein VSU01S_25040 [Vibrio superstes NBRC 103154]
MSASMNLYKSKAFESFSYYIGAIKHESTSINEEDYYLSNHDFMISNVDMKNEEVMPERYGDEFMSINYIEDVALDSYQDDFSEEHEDLNWKDYLSSELKIALQKLDCISRDVILYRWLAHEKESIQTLSRKHNIDAEHILHIENSTLYKLRELMGHIPLSNVA